MISRTASAPLVLLVAAAMVAAVTADAVGRGSMQEVSRRASKNKNKYSYYNSNNNKKDKYKHYYNDKEDKCIIPHVNITTGVVTSASCAPETMPSDYPSSSYGSSSYYSYYGKKKNRYSYNKKGNVNKKTTTCCDGYLCNDGSTVNNIFAKVGGDKCSLNETTSDNVPAHQCCLPAGVDVTGFVCKPEFVMSDGMCVDNFPENLKIGDFFSSDRDVANHFACICCSGSLIVEESRRRSSTFQAFCQAPSIDNIHVYATCPTGSKR